MSLSERDQRIQELATGFAIGDLDDAELRELYDALRQPGDTGAAAARLAWEALGTAMDLRAELGTRFQDQLTLRLREAMSGDTGRFESRMRERMRMNRPRLAPIEPPPATTTVRRHPLGWWTFGSLAVAAVISGWLALRESRAEQEMAMAEVRAVEGRPPTSGGRTMAVGDWIDRLPVEVRAGAQATFAWPDTATAVVAGPATIVAGRNGLSLIAGRAWVDCTHTFAVSVAGSDRPIECAPGTRAALEVREDAALIGVAAGSARQDKRAIAAGQGASAAGGATYAWRRGERPTPVDGGATIGGDLRGGDWSFAGLAVLDDPAAALGLAVTTIEGGDVAIAIEPGRLTVAVGAHEAERVALPGAPLLPRELAITCAGNALAIEVAGQRLRVPLPGQALGLGWTVKGAARIDRPGFHTGPEAEPPIK